MAAKYHSGGIKSGKFGKKLKPPLGGVRRLAAAFERVVFPIAGAESRAGGITRSHRALDISAQTGTPVYAARAGVVRIGGGDPGYGNLVRVQSQTTGLEALYAHLSAFAGGLQTGQRVQAGQLIGYVGSTGNSSGPHLHFEVNPIGPERFNRTRSDLAAVDPWSYLTGAVQAPVAAAAAIRGTVATQAQQAKATHKRVTGQGQIVPIVGVSPSQVQVSSGEAASGLSDPSAVFGGDKGGKGAAVTTAAQAAADQRRIFGTLGGPTYDEVKQGATRIGFVWGGFALIILGVLVMVWSYRDEIATAVESTKSDIQSGMGVAKTVAAAGA